MSRVSRVERITTCTSQHTLPDGEVTLLGAVETVTGSMTRICFEEAKLLVDCGIAQGNEARRWSFPDAARDVDAIILTHGHADHVGSLPTVLDGGFEGPIYGTPQTLKIADVVLADGVRLGGGNEADITRLRRRLKQLGQATEYDRAFRPPGFSGEVYLREAGHILGSASIELVTERTRMISSGDLGRPNSPLLRDYCERWERERALDLVVMETTYGDSEHPRDPVAVERSLEKAILRALETGGHILIPAFAIGRTQMLIYHLNTLVESNRIPDIPVAIDSPMALRITELHQRSRRLFDEEAKEKLAEGDAPLDFEGLYAVHRGRDSARLREVEDPMLIIAGSGMCTGGRIVGHLKALLPLAETTLLFVGFQAPGTLGRAISDAARHANSDASVEIDGQRIPVRATVETLAGLSAHADRNELKRWLDGLPHVKRLALNHGEPDSQDAFARWIS